jgi:hypothetical protein
MPLSSKKIPLVLLAIVAVTLSRAMFFFFDDPEGPNLLVVIGMATIIYFLSLGIYILAPFVKGARQSLVSLTEQKNFLVVLLIQSILAVAFYCCLYL